MHEVLWARRPRPVPGPDASRVGQWQPTTFSDLTAHRLELAAALDDGGRPAGADEGAVERLLLAFEEVVSNALRHGAAPVAVAVTATGSCWLLEVSDAAPKRSPKPAVGRDAAQGGLGLYLVARICGARLDRRRESEAGLGPDRLHPGRSAGLRAGPAKASRRRQPRAVIPVNAASAVPVAPGGRNWRADLVRRTLEW